MFYKMEKQQPLVSVITITLNRGNLIHRSIESVLNQTYSNIEHIIVDGGSIDNTKEIIKAYQNKDNRLKYYCLEENPPLDETIWFGYKQSKGEYITFLDDDDEYLPDKIEKQLSLISHLPKDYGMVYCWMDYFDSHKNKIISIHHPKLRGFVPKQVVAKPTISGTPTLFFRRHVFEETGGWMPSSVTGIMSDWALAAKVCQKYKVDFVEEVLVKVYVNHGATRMSDESTYYNDYISKKMHFHKYFLTTYAEYFTESPGLSIWHLMEILKINIISGNYLQALSNYKKILDIQITPNILIFPLVCILRKIKNELFR